MSDKLAYVEAHRDELDIFFVGSSRVLRAIVPEVVDAAMAELGCPGVRSYNLGGAGMSVPMIARVAEVVSRGPGERPHLVLIEPIGAFGPALRLPQNPRARFGNSASTLSLGFLQIWARPAPGQFAEEPLPHALNMLGLAPRLAVRIGLTLDHLRTLSVARLGLGQAQRAVFHEPSSPNPHASVLGVQRGYFSLEQTLEDLEGARRRRLLDRRLEPVEDGEVFANVIRAMVEAAAAAPEPLSGLERLLVERLLASGDGPHSLAGALLPPTVRYDGIIWARDVAHHLMQNAPVRPVVFVPPDELPRLYEMPNWFDRGHLAEAGARLFSEALARDLCPAALEGLRFRTGNR